jgi:uncharacterized protein YceK
MSLRIAGYVLVGVLMLSGCGSTTKSSAPTSSSTTPISTTVSSTTQNTIAPGEQVTTLYVPTSAQPGSIREYVVELQKINPTGFREWGSKTANGAERITLRADQEPLAADLVRRFGDRISVQLGLFAYPLDTTSASTCPSADFTTESVGLSATIPAIAPSLSRAEIRYLRSFDARARQKLWPCLTVRLVASGSARN